MSTIFGRETGLFFSYGAIFFERHDLSSLQKLVYIYFCRRTNGNRQSTPSYDSIANDCGCHRSSAIDAVNVLGSKGLVVKHRRKRHNGSDTSNMYIVFPPDDPFNSNDEDINDSGKAMPKKPSNLEGSSQATPRRNIKDLLLLETAGRTKKPIGKKPPKLKQIRNPITPSGKYRRWPEATVA